MSAVAEGGGEGRYSWRTRLAHLMPFASAIMLLSMIAAWFGLADGNGVLAWSWTGLFFVGFLLIFQAQAHQGTTALCVKCMEETPLDPEVAVRRNTRFLWFAHHLTKTVVILWLISLIGVGLLRRYVEFLHGAMWLNIPTDLFLMAMFWSSWQHHRLRPWCPYCRRWDKDDEAPVEVPPVPQGEVKVS